MPKSALRIARAQCIMKTNTLPIRRWSTSSLGESVDTSPVELAALGQHLERCRVPGGRLSAMQTAAQEMSGFASAHLVTTLLALAVLIGFGLLIL